MTESSKTPQIRPSRSRVVDGIYGYDDYRAFLRDFFEEQKQSKSFFSHRYFAMHAGFSSHSFCAYIMEGKRNLSAGSIRKMKKGLGLEGKRAQFFEALVLFNQAETEADREEYFRQMQRIRKSIDFCKVRDEQRSFYDKWYYPVVREVAFYGKWNGDYAKLGALVRPAISADEAREAVETLLAIGMLRRDESGALVQDAPVVTSERLSGAVIRNVRSEFFMRGANASQNIPKEERHLAYSILAMSDKTFREAAQLLDETRKRILVMALEDPSVDRVFDLNMQLFPLSEKLDWHSDVPPELPPEGKKTES